MKETSARRILRRVRGILRPNDTVSAPLPVAVTSVPAVDSADSGRAAREPDWFLRFPPFGDDVRQIVLEADDPVRYATILLAINGVLRRGVDGAFAELGVYRGFMSRAIHAAAPGRRLYLFDTFEGFPAEDAGGADPRFDDTSIDLVKTTIGDTRNVVFKPGYFPETAAGLEGERFAFVLLDADLHKPTLAGLQFFYPRVNRGGFIFLHDYNSPESDWAVSKAASEYLQDKPEPLVEIPDKWGTAIIAKV